MILMRDLRYIKDNSDDHHSMDLDNLLLIVAQTGVYLYGMFSILGSYFAKWDTVPDRVSRGLCLHIAGIPKAIAAPPGDPQEGQLPVAKERQKWVLFRFINWSVL